ncbi:5-oxoprolinase subunit PxpA [Flagellimonas sp. DF-77]|uniref:5-oxoprolinase subunit PxpA n=1 Tax=Flagellimonas algarum TaxID=3230298 RepID=UPI003398A412
MEYMDINCDVGEGVGNEADLFPLISSCNIACGGHAGDEQSMRDIARLAKVHQVKVGAHPGYPDKENFGRKQMELTEKELTESLQQQMNSFTRILSEENIPLHHIKAHGALYNTMAIDRELSEIYLRALRPFFKNGVKLYAPYGSVLAEIGGSHGVTVAYEVFADRNYTAQGQLVSRQKANALIQDPRNALDHMVRMAKNGRVMTIAGTELAIRADTFCIHGDTPTALEILVYLSNTLPTHGLSIEK